ncbi:nuclear envelope integral membrane protein [Leptinotarsa decemlineata]|uniref:nuclear envelope integral membrane protein n=1 Tax=Leptinotarsa decemlineata TaxID=7539 RepID=UPI003D309677
MIRNYLFIWIVLTYSLHSRAGQNADVHELIPGETLIIHSKSSEFHILCYKGQPKSIMNIWQSVVFNLKHDGDDFSVYEGSSPEEVEKEYLKKHSFWSFNIFSSNHGTIKLHPFVNSCIGVENSKNYSAGVTLILIDFWKVLLLLTGVSIFVTADKMSRNNVFQYMCGVAIGVCASVLILVYFIGKIFPRNTFMYGVLGCGWTIAVYVLQLLWENLQSIFTSYKLYLVWYIVATSLVSFAVCYIWGPVKNPRTLNLVRWSLQIAGLSCVFNSSQCREASVGQIILLLIGYNLSSSWLLFPKVYWRRKFPPKIKLLSDEEYYQQGVRETSKALDELRSYCLSPDCNQWKTIQKLRDIKRFAAFVEGSSHLSDQEILEYETSVQEDLTDDNSDMFSEEES